MNNVSLVGRLTKDIEIRRTTSGKQVTTFDLAVRRDKENTDFIPVVVWDTACEYLEKFAYKGVRIEAVGTLQMRQYQSNGKTNTVYEVIAKNVSILDDRKQEEVKQEKSIAPAIEYELSDDDLPF